MFPRPVIGPVEIPLKSRPNKNCLAFSRRSPTPDASRRKFVIFLQRRDISLEPGETPEREAFRIVTRCRRDLKQEKMFASENKSPGENKEQCALAANFWMARFQGKHKYSDGFLTAAVKRLQPGIEGKISDLFDTVVPFFFFLFNLNYLVCWFRDFLFPLFINSLHFSSLFCGPENVRDCLRGKYCTVFSRFMDRSVTKQTRAFSIGEVTCSTKFSEGHVCICYRY